MMDDNLTSKKWEKNLPKWSNKPTILDLEQNFTDAKQDYTSHINDIKKWRNNMYLTGPAAPKEIKGRSKVAPKLIQKQAEWKYPSLLDPFFSTPDLFNSYPTTAGDVARARQAEVILNKQFNNDIDKVKFMDDLVSDLVDIGTAIIKTGWESVTENVIETVPVYEFVLKEDDPVLIKFYTELSQLRNTDMDLYSNVSTPGLDEVLDTFEDTG